MTGCAIFDFDGVIADTEPLHWQAFQQVLAPRGLGFGWDEYLATFVGFDDRDSFRTAYREAGRRLDAPDMEGLIREKAVAFAALARARPDVLYPGAAELIRACHGDGWRLAICSGALRGDIEAVLDGSGLLARFEAVVTADDVAVSKPDPESYRRTLEVLGIRPGEGVVIEDTPAGVAAARGAGLRVVAVASTYPAADLAAADRVVAAIADLRPGVLAELLDPAR